MSTRTTARPRYIDGVNVRAMRTFTAQDNGCHWLVYKLRDPDAADRAGNRSAIQYCYSYREAKELVEQLDFDYDEEDEQ